VYTPAPPKPKETRRRRNVGSAQGLFGTDEADETDDSNAPTKPTFASSAGRPMQGAQPFNTADQHISPTTGKLSSGTLTTMLEVQEQANAEDGKNKL
jgi:hypothetical protein